MGGQTALNCALDLNKHGILKKYSVEMIGADADAIDKAEDRERFDIAMQNIGLSTPNSGIAHNMEQANAVAADLVFHVLFDPLLQWVDPGVASHITRRNLRKFAIEDLICPQLMNY